MNFAQDSRIVNRPENRVKIMGIRPGSLILILLIVLVLFGRRINVRGLGEDLGASWKGFRKAMQDDPVNPPTQTTQVYEAEKVEPTVEQKK